MLFKNQFLALTFAFSSFLSMKGQTLSWNEVDANSLSQVEKMDRANAPDKFKIFQINLASLSSSLLNAPSDISGEISTITASFPNAEGKTSTFEIYKSQMMEAELLEANPGIYNYTGINKQDPTNTIKISITPAFGMHVIGFDGSGSTYYIDTYTSDFNSFIFYKRSDIQNNNSTFRCYVESPEEEIIEDISTLDYQTLSIDNKFRTYRLAMACTIEYAAFHVNRAPAGVPRTTEAQKKAIVLAAMNVTVNRLNAIYERDLSIRFVLVASNTNIIFVNSDNFNNNDAGVLIDQSQSVITQIIGTANFDIGHTVSTGGGGLAGPSPCVSSRKATGITGSPSPVGDPFDIDYVAHEIGHQFGANHTFNAQTGSCAGGNRNLATAVEPGSGSTIMAYAGICGNNDNVQRNSDAYFHQTSIKEITAFLLSSQNSCAVVISGTNATPTVTTQGNKTIPHSTPFILTANGTDANNQNSLTYTWEQTNTNQSSTQPPVATSTTGPNYRSLAPTASSSRSFPATVTVLQGATDASGIVTSKWERTPTVARNMKFSVTVRDNNALNGGQTASADATITFANVGPFLITSPNNITSTQEPTWAYNSSKTITWNVAGTTGNGINTANVNILLSTDNGETYTTLAANTPNDGNETITVPSLTNSSLNCRIKIEAVGNIFYTVSKRFAIYPTASNEDFEFDNFKLFPNPTNSSFNVSFTSTTGNEIEMQLFDIRGRKLDTFKVENTGSVQQEIDLTKHNTGIYLIKIIDGSNESTKKIIKK